MPVYNVSAPNRWKISPLTKVDLLFTDGHTYSFGSIKKSSYFKLREIREPNDEGGFTLVAYEVESEFTPVQLIPNNWWKFHYHANVLTLSQVWWYFGKSNDPAYADHKIQSLPHATIKNISIESLEVKTDEQNMETTIKIKAITSVDLFDDVNTIFEDLYPNYPY